MRERLDRAAGLGGDDEDGLREVDRLLDREDRVGVGRVEHLQPQALGAVAEGLADDLGAE